MQEGVMRVGRRRYIHANIRELMKNGIFNFDSIKGESRLQSYFTQ